MKVAPHVAQVGGGAAAPAGRAGLAGGARLQRHRPWARLGGRWLCMRVQLVSMGKGALLVVAQSF